MKKAIALTTMALLSCLMLGAREVLNTASTTMVLDAEPGRELQIVYYGSLLNQQDVENLRYAGVRPQRAYPAHGLIGKEEEALSVIFTDGNMTLDLKVVSVSRETWEDGEILSVTSRDSYYPFSVTAYYKTYAKEDMISTWTVIANEGKKPVKLTRFDSGSLPFRYSDAWVSYLYGSWANEGRVVSEPVTRGMKVIKNRDGVRNSHTMHGEVMISLDGEPRENAGRTIGAAICYSGNYELRINTLDSDYHRLYAGICPEDSNYDLAGKESFTTPELAYTFSEDGLGGVSRNFHRWGRNWKVAHGNVERRILLNSWEGVYFDINEEGMDRMMGDIASMGGELFVMDDGWFGEKYRRLTDNSSLGDWEVDKVKLPNGIGGLVKTAEKHGIKFGIWIEPEMVNTKSELYEQHPDWVLKAENRDLVTGRGGTQLVLDLSNPKVQDFVVGVVDGIMEENPDIAYIKWDANMDISAHGSQYLKNQNHLFIEYHRGLEKVLNRVREKYPDLTIQACASGGGRASYGIMPWFDEFWVSDDTDALQRLYMQWGTSYFYPAITMASHISAAPNHQTGRVVPMKFRIDVAMSGRLGMEIQPMNMSEAEKELCREAISDYKMIRPVVQFGDLYRLNSPYDNDGITSLMYCSEDKEKAVFYWWKPLTFCDEHLPVVKMEGLDPDKYYRIRELHSIDRYPLSCEGKIFSGRFLMENGISLPYTHNVKNQEFASSWASRVLYLEAVDSPRTGDLVFVGMPENQGLGGMAGAIGAATGSAGEMDIIHVAMLAVDDDGIQVIDATTNHNVDRHPLSIFIEDFCAELFSSLEMDVPQGVPGTNPKAMSEEDVLETVCFGAFGSLVKNE